MKNNPKKGDQSNFALESYGSPMNTSYTDAGVNYYFPIVDKDMATVEAEKGEVIMHDADEDGNMEQFRIGGKRHEQGGTMIAATPGDFIFSDRKKLAIKGAMVENFGKSPDSNKSYTPAQLAKQYNINKYKALMEDPEADKLQKKTAEMMIENYNQKLAQLALAQEAMKGFPDGVPGFAMPILEELAPQTAQMAKGGLVKANFGMSVPIDPYTLNQKTPTNRDNRFNRGDMFMSTWERLIPGLGDMDNAAAQGAMYDHMMKTPEGRKKISKMWGEYGLTNQGKKNKDLMALTKNGVFNKDVLNDDGNLTKLREAYVDGLFGDRQLDPRERMRFEVPTRTPFKFTPPTVATPPKPLGIPPIPTGIPPSTPEVKEQPPGTETGEKTVTKTPESTDMKWWTQDKMNTMQAFMNRYNIKKYLPWEGMVNPVVPDPTFMDPTRAIAANSEQANIQTQAAAMLAGPQRQRAVGSSIQGQAAGQAANIMSQYDERNVGISNQFAGMSSEIQNQAQMQNLAAKKRIFDGTTIANDQFDKEKKMAQTVYLKNFINGMTNSQKTHWMNSMFDQFDIDPTSGAIQFGDGKSLNTTGKSGGGSGGTTFLDAYMKLKNDPAYAGASDEVLRKQAEMLSGVGQKSQTDTNGDGVADRTRQLQNFMNMNPMIGR
jgi:hypothetical protein